MANDQENDLTRFEKISVLFLVAMDFNLFLPLSLTNSAIIQAFTAYRVTFYFFVVVLAVQLAKRKGSVVFPGWIVLLLLPVSAMISTYLNEMAFDEEAWYFSGIEVFHVLMAIIVILTLRSLKSIRLYFDLNVLLSIIFALVALTDLIHVSDFSSQYSAVMIQNLVQGQMTTTGIEGSMTRTGALWLDSNNLAYTLGVSILYLLFILNTERSNRFNQIYRYSSLILLVSTCLSTLSRGGVICLMLTVPLLFALINLRQFTRTTSKRYVLAMLAIVCLSGMLLSGSVTVLLERLYMATGLVSTQVAMTGMETGRIDAALLAFDEFLTSPLFGLGAVAKMGWSGTTGNHVGFLDILGKFGIAGAILNFVFLIVCVNKYRGALTYLKKSKSKDIQMGYFVLIFCLFLFLQGLFRTVQITHMSAYLLGFSLAVFKLEKAEFNRSPRQVKDSAFAMR